MYVESGERVSWRQLVPPPPPLEAHRLTVDQIILRILNFTKSLRIANSNQANDTALLQIMANPLAAVSQGLFGWRACDRPWLHSKHKGTGRASLRLPNPTIWSRP